MRTSLVQQSAGYELAADALPPVRNVLLREDERRSASKVLHVHADVHAAVSEAFLERNVPVVHFHVLLDSYPKDEVLVLDVVEERLLALGMRPSLDCRVQAIHAVKAMDLVSYHVDDQEDPVVR